MSLILMESPGAGKGTQAEKITDTYGIPHTSTGDILRAAMKSETTLGLETKSHIDKGKLAPNEVINRVVRECLVELDTDKGFLSDGFPRIPDQVGALDIVLGKLNEKADAVIDIHVEKGALTERLAGRFICRTCGAAYHKLFNPSKVEGTCDRYGGHKFYQGEDDKPEMVKNCLAVNIESNASILAFCKEQGLMHTIDDNREIDTVFSDVKKVIDEN